MSVARLQAAGCRVGGQSTREGSKDIEGMMMGQRCQVLEYMVRLCGRGASAEYEVEEEEGKGPQGRRGEMTGAGTEGGWPKVENREQSWDGEGIEESRNRELGGAQGEEGEGGST